MNVEVREVTEREVEFYRTNGWVKLPALIAPANVRELRAWLEEGMDDKTNPYLPSSTFRFWKEPSQQPGPVREFAHSQGMARAAGRLIGVSAVRYWFDACLAKDPVSQGGAETRLHQDFSVQPFDRRGGLQFWVALDDIPANMGTVHFLNGSHRLGPLGRSLTWPEGTELPDVYPELKELEMSLPNDMRIGDVTVHDSLTVHGAGQNLGDRPRWAMTLAHMRADTQYTGMSNQVTDGLGLVENEVFDHPQFPLFTV